MSNPCPAGGGAQPAAPASLLPRYEAFRAAFNAAIAALYERSTMPVRDIACAAGVTERAIYDLIRRLHCRPRRPAMQARGGGFGPRREEPAGERLDADGIVEALAALRQAARQLDEHGEARRTHARREADDASARQEQRIARRAERDKQRARMADIRSLRHLSSVFRDLARIGRDREPRRVKPRKAGETVHGARDKRYYQWRPGLVTPLPPIAPPLPRPVSPPAAPAAMPGPLPPLAPEVERRINEIAEQYYAREQDKGPRIRKLW